MPIYVLIMPIRIITTYIYIYMYIMCSFRCRFLSSSISFFYSPI